MSSTKLAAPTTLLRRHCVARAETVALDFESAAAAFGILFSLQIANLDVALSFWFFRCLPLFVHNGYPFLDYKVKYRSRSRQAAPNSQIGLRLTEHDAVIRVYDDAGNVIEA